MFAKRFYLLCRRTLASGDDCTGMSHPFALWSGLAGYESHDRFGDVLFDEFRRFFLSSAAYLTYYDD